jgi:hypothetical protein
MIILRRYNYDDEKSGAFIVSFSAVDGRLEEFDTTPGIANGEA